MIKAGKGPWSCHGPGPSCNPPPSPPGPAGPSGPSGSLDWCQTEWKNAGGNAANYTNCNKSGLCQSPHGLDCCTPPTAKYPTPGCPSTNPNCKNAYPCKDQKQANFWKSNIFGSIVQCSGENYKDRKNYQKLKEYYMKKVVLQLITKEVLSYPQSNKRSPPERWAFCL